MDKNVDYNYYGMPPFSGPNMYDMNADPTMDSNAMFNRYLSMQMEYKIKCKEYEKLTSKSDFSRDSGRKVE